mmetsp:Transcript_31569/g.71418  ORF Transcript_31569/g.71418 Transcript_31569/m.71418 type:complete len:381 (-) Transcript_31569:32-1174(-)
MLCRLERRPVTVDHRLQAPLPPEQGLWIDRAEHPDCEADYRLDGNLPPRRALALPLARLPRDPLHRRHELVKRRSQESAAEPARHRREDRGPAADVPEVTVREVSPDRRAGEENPAYQGQGGHARYDRGGERRRLDPTSPPRQLEGKDRAGYGYAHECREASGRTCIRQDLLVLDGRPVNAPRQRRTYQPPGANHGSLGADAEPERRRYERQQKQGQEVMSAARQRLHRSPRQRRDEVRHGERLVEHRRQNPHDESAGGTNRRHEEGGRDGAVDPPRELPPDQPQRRVQDLPVREAQCRREDAHGDGRRDYPLLIVDFDSTARRRKQRCQECQALILPRCFAAPSSRRGRAGGGRLRHETRRRRDDGEGQGREGEDEEDG